MSDGEGIQYGQRTIEKSTLFGSNVTESGISVWEGVSDLTTSGSGTGDIENGRQETSIPCWRRSSEVKGTASSSNLGWEKERVDRGSKEKPAEGRMGKDQVTELTPVKPTRHVPRTYRGVSIPADI